MSTSGQMFLRKGLPHRQRSECIEYFCDWSTCIAIQHYLEPSRPFRDLVCFDGVANTDIGGYLEESQKSLVYVNCQKSWSTRVWAILTSRGYEDFILYIAVYS